MSQVPVVPISQHRSHAGLVFTAGQIGAEADGSIPTEFSRQVELAFDSLAAQLESAGASMATVLKANLFISRREDFPEMNGIYAERFADPWPARTTIVTDLVLPELFFEIEVVAKRV